MDHKITDFEFNRLERQEQKQQKIQERLEEAAELLEDLCCKIEALNNSEIKLSQRIKKWRKK